MFRIDAILCLVDAKHIKQVCIDEDQYGSLDAKAFDGVITDIL